MARPIREGMEYFPHDTDAVNDEKIEVLMSLYGTKGYAFYFILLERIYRTPEYELRISEAETVRILSRKVTISEDEFKQMLSTALKYDLFDGREYEERGVLTSKGIKKRARRVEDKRLSDRKRYEKDKEISEAETNEGKHSGNTPTETTSKGKDSNIYTLDFEKFYKVYPNPEDKRRTFNNWRTCLKGYIPDQLMAAARNYTKAKSGKDKQFLKTSANFLGKDKPFEDYIANSEPPEATNSSEIEYTPEELVFINHIGGNT